ncbi:hypothetical protein [Rhodopirellula baltica]|nr:hypothetical protein [Rhodopirellula baltica]
MSDDRRTLTLDLFVVDRLNDHVRFIVDAELNSLESFTHSLEDISNQL